MLSAMHQVLLWDVQYLYYYKNFTTLWSEIHYIIMDIVLFFPPENKDWHFSQAL